MSLSIQTNVNSLVAQQNMNVNNAFQSKTIQQLTSGYRINQSGDDAAGLAVANKFRSSVAELTQGVANGNDGLAQLQIMDGGMSNVSQILDRLKTLATQSASGAFTGSRTSLNSEFQTDLQEINRQAQSIGLNAGGTFAKSLSVYLGAGSGSAGVAGSSAAALANSAVAVDLSNSTVDAQSLGLQGMQVAGATDIGAGAGVHSVANVVAASTGNQTSSAGYSTLYFSGAGFSGANKVAAQVNLSGVTDVTKLANAINAAIQTAAGGNSQAAGFFSSANIVASVHTDATGGSELAFTSGSAAFQVEAGDQMANAFLGNFTDSTHSTGAALNTATVAGASTAALTTPTTAFTGAAGAVMVRIQGGGLAAPQDLTLGSDATINDVVTDLTNQIQANSSLRAAGVTVGISSNKLTFTSGTGEQLGAQVTGDTTNLLGYGAWVTGNSNSAVVVGASGAQVDYNNIAGGSAYDGTSAAVYGNAYLNVSINGTVRTANVALNSGTSATKAVYSGNNTGAGDMHGLNLTIDNTLVTFAAGDTTAAKAVQEINSTAGIDVTASIDGTGKVVLTRNAAGFTTADGGANTNGQHITVTGSGITQVFGGAVSSTAAQNISAADLQGQLNSQFDADATMAAAGLKAQTGSNGNLEILSQNGTYFRVGLGASNNTTANIGFGAVAGFASAAPTVAAAAFAANEAGGVSAFTDLNGTGTPTSPTHGFTFTALANGNESQALSISANDQTTGAAQSLTITLKNNGTNRSGSDIDQAITYINQQLQQSNDVSLQSIVAVKENDGGVQKIDFLSSLPSFSVGVGSSASGNGVNNAPADGLPQARTYTASTVGKAANMAIDTQAGGEQAITAITAAVAALGSAQAAVGKGENQLNYAINLASSQITNFSAAEAQIRDADIAQQAANLTKAQVLQQATIAAMAQANTAPQAVLKLLQV